MTYLKGKHNVKDSLKSDIVIHDIRKRFIDTYNLNMKVQLFTILVTGSMVLLSWAKPAVPDDDKGRNKVGLRQICTNILKKEH